MRFALSVPSGFLMRKGLIISDARRRKKLQKKFILNLHTYYQDGRNKNGKVQTARRTQGLLSNIMIRTLL